MVWFGEGSGTDTLTFEYMVQRRDADNDGVWLQTASASDDTVVFLENGATITGGNPVRSTAARVRTNLPTTGDARRTVNATTSHNLWATAARHIARSSPISVVISRSSSPPAMVCTR